MNEGDYHQVIHLKLQSNVKVDDEIAHLNPNERDVELICVGTVMRTCRASQ